MFCKIVIEVTKTIADVLQGLYRNHRDNRHKSTNNALPVFNDSYEVITTRYAMQDRNTYTPHRCFQTVR